RLPFHLARLARPSKPLRQRQKRGRSGMARFLSRRSTRRCASAPAKQTRMHFDRKRKKQMKTVWRNIALLGAAGLAAAVMIDPSLAQAPAAAAPAAAPKAPDLVINKADDCWMMISSALVLMMTVPGLALFYGGMVRTKNMLSMLTQVFAIQCIVCVAWFVYAYSLAFTEGSGFTSPFIGGLSRLFMAGIDVKSPAAT